MGRAKALYVLGCGPECRETPWDGLYPLDPELDDELENAGIGQARRVSNLRKPRKKPFEQAMATEFAD